MSNLYHYFASKDELFRQLLKPATDTLEAMLNEHHGIKGEDILMDEATASLDVENETFIQESLSRLVKDKTVIIIAHRMRTVAGADKIVVLKEGKVDECGTPAQLTASGGFYKRMQDIRQGALEWNI